MSKENERQERNLDAEIRNLPLFGRVIERASQALFYWYPDLEKGEFSCFDPEKIEFVSDNRYLVFEKEDRVGDNLVTQALRLAGEKPENFPGRQNFEIGVSYVNPFREPLVVYFRESYVKDLLDKDKDKQLKAANFLGRQLIEINLGLLPELKLAKDPQLINLPEEKLLAFFQGQGLQEAAEIFSYLLKEDPSKKTFCYGAQVILGFQEEQGGIIRKQFTLGEEVDKGIVLFLSDRPGASFSRAITDELFGAGAGRFVRFQRNLKRERLVGQARDFLRKLKLGSINSALEAYKESEIPEIFIQRRRIKKGLDEYPA